MGHLVAEAKLVYGCRRVTAADDRGSIRLCQSLCDSDGSCCKRRILEYAHRSVPYDRLCVLHRVSKQRRRLRPDVTALSVCGHLISIINLYLYGCVDRVREIRDGYGVNGKQQLLAELLSLVHHLLTIIDLLVVNQRLTDLVSLCL